MCDTQALIAGNGVWFAKNSDREPHEPQAVVRIPRVRGDRTATVRTTYIDVAQVADRHAVILSKPCWLWGAEMGVNEHGLAIGNEAIFSRQRSLAPALLGMDLLRLALERATTATEAIDVIAELLERHGQGGPAGFADKGFHYDSSFILADPQEAWIMETAGREWVTRPVTTYDAISNGLSTTTDYTRSSPGVSGSFAAHDTHFLPFFAASRQRRALSRHCLAETAAKAEPGFADLARHLRTHARGDDPLRGSNRDICMHAAGPIRRSQTTGSLVAWLRPDGPRILVTGTTAPCLSPMRPVSFSHAHRVFSADASRAPIWEQWQPVQAAALFDAEYRQRVRARIATWEDALFTGMHAPTPPLEALEQQLQACTREILRWPRPPITRALTFARQLWA